MKKKSEDLRIADKDEDVDLDSWIWILWIFGSLDAGLLGCALVDG